MTWGKFVLQKQLLLSTVFNYAFSERKLSHMEWSNIYSKLSDMLISDIKMQFSEIVEIPKEQLFQEKHKIVQVQYLSCLFLLLYSFFRTKKLQSPGIYLFHMPGITFLYISMCLCFRFKIWFNCIFNIINIYI